jgi:hypothetical protein
LSKQQVLELPPNQTLQQLQTLINDRLRDLNLILNGLMSNPADADLDMAQFLIHNLADPVADLDGVNLRTLKRGTTAPAAIAPTTAATSTSGGAYTIVSEAAATLGDGDVSPAYVVGLDRVGSPEEVWIYAESAPLSGCAINWQVQLGGAGAFQALLSADLVLPIGSLGPVFSTAFALKAQFPHGTVVKMVATSGGSAGLVSAGVVMKR